MEFNNFKLQGEVKRCALLNLAIAADEFMNLVVVSWAVLTKVHAWCFENWFERRSCNVVSLAPTLVKRNAKSVSLVMPRILSGGYTQGGAIQFVERPPPFIQFKCSGNWGASQISGGACPP